MVIIISIISIKTSIKISIPVTIFEVIIVFVIVVQAKGAVPMK